MKERDVPALFSTMAPSAMSTESDPPGIRAKIEELKIQKKTVDELISRLEVAQLEILRLEREIVEYHASVAPIQNCPEEILHTIFELYTEHKPRLIANILGVCRRWYSIAINAPTLWNRIDVILPTTWDMQGATRKIDSMINLFLQRSISLPLHIRLDCSEIQPGSVLFSNHLSDYLYGAVPSLALYTVRLHVESWDTSAFTGTGSVCSPNHGYNTISLLVGEDGVHMKRWQTFELILTQETDMDDEVWRRLSYEAPNLIRLVTEDFYFDPDDRVKGLNPLSNMTSLKELTINGTMSHIDLIGVKETSLTFLSLGNVDLRAHHHSLLLSRFVNLEHLMIVEKRGYHPSAVTSRIPITLPRLQILNVSSPEHGSIQWTVPILQTLRIYGSLSSGLPGVRALHVYLTLRNFEPTFMKEGRDILRQLVSQYKEMEALTLPEVSKPIWETYTSHITQEKESVVKLPNITFE